MVENYAQKLPRAKNDVAFDGSPPAFTANQAQIGNPAASSVLTFSDKSTVVEISAVGGSSGAGSAAIIGKWGTASVTGTNFDIMVMAGATRDFVIPVSVIGVSSLAGANVMNGLYPAIALKHATNVQASVLTVEY